MKPTSYFVTGTDTEVGKTLVACALILKTRQTFPHLTVSGFKPVVAGTYPNELGQRCNEDLLSLIAASGLEQTQSDICPYTLDEAAAPHLRNGRASKKADIRNLEETGTMKIGNWTRHLHG